MTQQHRDLISPRLGVSPQAAPQWVPRMSQRVHHPCLGTKMEPGGHIYHDRIEILEKLCLIPKEYSDDKLDEYVDTKSVVFQGNFICFINISLFLKILLYS